MLLNFQSVAVLTHYLRSRKRRRVLALGTMETLSFYWEQFQLWTGFKQPPIEEEPVIVLPPVCSYEYLWCLKIDQSLSKITLEENCLHQTAFQNNYLKYNFVVLKFPRMQKCDILYFFFSIFMPVTLILFRLNQNNNVHPAKLFLVACRSSRWRRSSTRWTSCCSAWTPSREVTAYQRSPPATSPTLTAHTVVGMMASPAEALRWGVLCIKEFFLCILICM